MTELYNPIDMDGIPCTEDITNYIQDLSIVFAGAGDSNTTDLEPGETALINFKITVDNGYSFSVQSVHPVTGELYTLDVQNSGNLTSHPSGYYASVRIACGVAPISLSKVMVLPTAVSFLSPEEEEPTAVKIATRSPLLSTIMMNSVTIEIDNDFNKYVYKEIEEKGLLRINGVSPIQGNIDITGVGETIVLVKGAVTEDTQHV